MKDLMPGVSLEHEELVNYWIEKFESIVEEHTILPRWAKRHYRKYHKNKDSSEYDADAIENSVTYNNIEDRDGVGSGDSDDEELDGDPRTKRRENAFYQNVEDQEHFRNEEDLDIENDELLQLINISNPRGEDFMKWAKNEPLPNYNEIMYRLNSLKNREAVPDEVGNLSLNDKQRLFRDIVHDWVKEWVLANEGSKPWPKALRLFLMGSPGAGKSRCVKATMDTLGDILGVNYKDVIRQTTPTGCASFQMSAGATTVHKLFGLHIRSRRTELDDKTVKMLSEKFKNGLCLLVIDEFSMESREIGRAHF